MYKIDKIGIAMFTWHSNIINKGSHYIVFGSSVDEAPLFKIDKAICPGSDE